ncbi:hypothetical protein DVH02_02650 [Streptomyces corynorhini]|uniref:Roadblock/LAMTOR2 domain-containing protein n=1 Tax=Streptomyces corynorhini TaxID=2282652 RepID=A0A370BHD5_9ACTN|nr:hypothetical protein DVH02_02650 [Streptomyces corynorhini]
MSRLLETPGVTGAALVDAVTGLTYCAVGDPSAVGDGVDTAELAALVTDRVGPAGTGGELESLVVTSARRYHVVRTVRRAGDPLLLVAALDRDRTNLALALRQLNGHAEGMLA